MFTKALVFLVSICGPFIFAGNGWADPSAQSICDMPQMRGTAAYNKYCGGGNSGNSYYDYGAAQRAQAAAAAAAQQQREAELEQQRIDADNQRRMQELENQAKFIDDRNAAASTLRGSTDSTTSGGLDASGLRGSSETVGGLKEPGLRGTNVTTELRGSKPLRTQTPNLDPMVVDARRVPSGLPKSVDKAIVSGYSDAPPGVSDRVRKGFQAVATHDWKLARSWFQDALNHDPDNAGLKRLVELADYTEKHIPHGKISNAAQRTAVQLPQDSDMELLFPDLKAAKAKPASADAQKPMDLPQDSDIEFLFPGRPARDAKELSDYVLGQAIERTANDPVLIRVSNRLRSRNPPIPAN
ncbi:MAG: hypothetical protein ACYC9L_14285 [Sulfuricaulis sp.]